MLPGPAQVAMAIGIHGQWISVDREKNIIIVKLSSQAQALKQETDQRLMNCFAAIVGAVS